MIDRLKSGLLVALFSVSVLAVPSALAQTYYYDRIEVVGNVRIDEASVIRISGLPESGNVTSAQLGEAYRSIADRAIFEDLSINPRGNLLEILVVEFPTVNEISIEGNKRIEDEELIELVQSTPKQVYLPSLAEEDAARIAQRYLEQGRFAATVTPRIIRRRDNRIDIVFEIVEGKVVEIERLAFVGNKAFSDNRLRRVLFSKQANLLRAFSRRDTYAAERLELDKTLLTDFYLSRGYVDFNVESVSAELTRERDAFFLTFKIQEGQQYSFGEISATTDVAEVDPAEFLDESRIKTGRVYSPVYVEDTVERMEFLASEKDMPFLRAVPQITPTDDRTLDIEFQLVRGPRITVERIDIEGNVTTLDRVIRRQFSSVEGDPFEPRKIAEAAERIRALGFFSNVEVTETEGAQSRRVVKVAVEEQPTGSLSFGVSYGQDVGIAGNIALTERNLLGRGQTLSFSVESREGAQDYAVSFVEPSLLDRDLELGLVIGTRRSSRNDRISSIEEFRVGGSLRFPVTETTYVSVGSSYSRFESTPYFGGSYILRRDPGLSTKLKERRFGLSLEADFNSVRTGLSPTQGYVLRASQDLSFGEEGYTAAKTTALAGAQTTVFGEDVTLTAVAEGGVVRALSGSDTRLLDRFQMHSGIIRGFSSYGMGPRSLSTHEEALGGNYFAALRLESRFPLGAAQEIGLSGGTFLDAGSIWGLDQTLDGPVSEFPEYWQDVDDSFKLRSTVGVSLFWTTFLGPLRFNFSHPLKTYEEDKTQNFELTLSSQF